MMRRVLSKRIVKRTFVAGKPRKQYSKMGIKRSPTMAIPKTTTGRADGEKPYVDIHKC